MQIENRMLVHIVSSLMYIKKRDYQSITINGIGSHNAYHFSHADVFYG